MALSPPARVSGVKEEEAPANGDPDLRSAWHRRSDDPDRDGEAARDRLQGTGASVIWRPYEMQHGSPEEIADIGVWLRLSRRH
jgi:hypothetical protein